MNTTINEQRYQFVLTLYMIRTQYPQMGLFQPDFIWVIFRSMMPSKYIRTDDDIKVAVNDWCEDPARATTKYGHISKWNTSLVTNMKKLFEHKIDFNDDISKWNVSNVADMSSIVTVPSTKICLQWMGCEQCHRYEFHVRRRLWIDRIL